ncbi:dienelactone hydrolase family protein [Bradyrhizobium sp. 62B]|uniref:dienelactone hydrolase family protein n=1 Tax=Bradyrhizobium sp. 62B TaxID=2898442 RepID=UPI0035E2392A
MPGGEGFAASVAFYPGCFTINSPYGPPFEIVRNRIDHPVLILMGGEDIETPAAECVSKLQLAKDAGAPAEWYIYPKATHWWDCTHLNGASRIDSHGRNRT